ncbi:MAG: aminoglycoside phosphotransferase family protein [Clostridiales bacterium]|nr:aminoglycoside phosphotransferase family protein [Clostridiales bacterium]
MKNNDIDIIKYLENIKLFKNTKTVKAIRVGASGANIYEVIDQSFHYIVKQSRLDDNTSKDEKLPDYEKEMQFYQSIQQYNLINTPKVFYIDSNQEIGNVIVQKYYEPISKDNWNKDKIFKAIDSCAKLHSYDIDYVDNLDIRFKEFKVDTSTLENAFNEWKCILEENKIVIDQSELQYIFTNFNMVCNILNALPHNICHGDFHADNILSDNDEIVVCDWQNICIGKGASDIAFFVNRGESEGLKIDEDQVLDQYCERLSFYTSNKINKSDVKNVMKASKVFVSFIHWPYYLKDETEEKIVGIYSKMVKSMNSIKFDQ